MVDKLIVLCSKISEKFRSLMEQDGRYGRGYKRYLDLRQTECKLPVRLHYSGFKNGIHKADLVDVARLGWPRTTEILKEVFLTVHNLRICRIDLCLDLLGIAPEFFLENCRIPRRQSLALFRSKEAITLYPVYTKQKKLLIYDRLALLRKEGDPLGEFNKHGDHLTRIEVQYMGAGVPFRRFSEIHRYSELDVLHDLKFEKLQIDATNSSPMQLLTAEGLRALISKYGLQVASKRFSPEEWAYLEKKFFKPMEMTELPPLKRLMRKSNEDWLEGRIRSARLTRPRKE